LSIIDLLVHETNKQLLDQELFIEVSQEVKEWILNQFYKPAYGARPMRRAIQKVIEDPLSEEILRGNFKGIYKIKVILEANTPVFVTSEEAAVLSGIS